MAPQQACRISYLIRLNNNSFVADPPSNALLIEILEQRDSVFAGDADQVFELAHVDLGRLGLLLRHELPQTLERGVMEDQFVGKLDQNAVAQQESDKFL